MRRRWIRGASLPLALLILLAHSGLVHAQELEPGLYQNAPIRLNVALAGYTYSTGNVLIDASLPLTDVTARLNVLGLGYLRTMRLFGRSAKIDLGVPIIVAHFAGKLAGTDTTRDITGLADPRVRVQINLLGGPALDLPAYAKYRQGTILGVSFQVALPLGQYDRTRIVNIGANRWSFRPELGLSQRWGQLYFELAGGAWLFTHNNEFTGSSVLTQDPIPFIKGNAIYTFRRGLWLSFSYGYATGGETQVDGVARNDLQVNNRVGVALALPLGRGSSLKLVYNNGLATRIGGDFDSYSVVYSYSWGGRRTPAPAPAGNP
jgi:hypothetical protein